MPEPIGLSGSAPPETVLDPPPEAAATALAAALQRPADERREALEAVVAAWPRFLDAWARLGEHADGVVAYACFRVGYHRGLDQLRGSGWRGSGYVRWRHPTNQGFLRALDGLRRAAAEIGEDDEAQRCDAFLHQLDPDWDLRTPDG